jgi:hypothetical protein
MNIFGCFGYAAHPFNKLAHLLGLFWVAKV